jgi:hypothetical protein
VRISAAPAADPAPSQPCGARDSASEDLVPESTRFVGIPGPGFGPGRLR